MSLFAGINSLPFWGEDHLELRDLFQHRIVHQFGRTLRAMNPAFKIVRTEGPILTPANYMSPEYMAGDADDVFKTNVEKASQQLVLRAETTASSYAVARALLRASKAKPPLCVWQVGKSFRTEKNDGASAKKLRFNEFSQIEFQCIYRADTKANYRAALMDVLSEEVARFTRLPVRTTESDRLPRYSESTIDVETLFRDQWKEVASCSIRTDFADDLKVCEIAIGLDRVAVMATEDA